MPKIAKERTQENQRRIEAAALELFTSQGFHGTNNRDIAKKIGASTGTIYTYFPSKEAIFASMAEKYRSHLDQWRREALGSIRNPLSQEGIQALAAAIQSTMYEEPEYFLLVLSDVVEFKNQHFLEIFRDLPQQLRRVMGPALDKAKSRPDWRGEDPAFVLGSMYAYFFTYFLMERYMQGQQHLGMPNEQATEAFINLLLHGLWRPAEQEEIDLSRRDVPKGLHQAARERIEYIRFLSGRLWNLPPDLPPHHTENSNGEGPVPQPILFLPQMPKKRIDENQLRLEAAALELFTKQGFHGTNIRDIAKIAQVSQGAIYTYYQNKEAIFEGLVRSYLQSMRHFVERVFRIMKDPFSKHDLRIFAAAMRSMVFDDAEYWLLMYLDAVEFKSRHFLRAVQNVPEQFRRLLEPTIDQIKRKPGWCGQDPALVMAMIYFYFHTYFVIDKVMHGNHHLAVADHDEVIERFINILSHGLVSPTPERIQSSSTGQTRADHSRRQSNGQPRP